MGSTADGTLQFFTDSTEKVRITPSGTVGIGITTNLGLDGEKLKVVSPYTAIEAGGGTSGIVASGSSFGVKGSGGTYGVIGAGTTYDMYALNGKYGGHMNRTNYYLALQSDRNMVLYDNGGAVWWTGTQVSDLRMKKNIAPIDGALDKILKLNGVRFNWIDEKNMGSQNEIGVIAQEVEKDFPELIYNNKESDRKLVDYGKLSAVLIQALKEEHQQKNDLQIQVDGLAQRISTLENK